MAVAAAVVLAAVCGGPASAQQAPLTFGFQPLSPNPNPDAFFDEFKIGSLGHDVAFGGDNIEHGPDLNLEVLFRSPDWLAVIGSPRPHIGGDINLSGQTSDAYAGLTWGVSLIQNIFTTGDYIFVQGSLGGAYQDGYTTAAPKGRKNLGSPVLFRESAEIGYQITPMISISAMLDHISNANLANHNAGITSAGGRVGFKF